MKVVGCLLTTDSMFSYKYSPATSTTRSSTHGYNFIVTAIIFEWQSLQLWVAGTLVLWRLWVVKTCVMWSYPSASGNAWCLILSSNICNESMKVMNQFWSLVPTLSIFSHSHAIVPQHIQTNIQEKFQEQACKSLEVARYAQFDFFFIGQVHMD